MSALIHCFYRVTFSHESTNLPLSPRVTFSYESTGKSLAAIFSNQVFTEAGKRANG